MTNCSAPAEEEKPKRNLSRRLVGTVFKGIGKAGDAILVGMTTAMWETGKHAKVTQLRTKLSKLQRDLQKLHTALGEAVYEHIKQEKEDILKQESIIDIVDQLEKCEERMAQIEAEIAMLKEEIEEVGETEGMGLETLSRLAKDGDDEERYGAVSIIVQRGDEETIPVLVDALGDENTRVRLGALRGLYKLNTEESMNALLDALGDEHPDARSSAATYLGWIGNAAFSDNIAQLLKDDDEQVRKSAAIALANLASQSAIEPLIDALSDRDVGVRQQSVIALRRITHQFFNFRAYVDEEERNQAIARWRDWWADYQTATTDEPPVTEEPNIQGKQVVFEPPTQSGPVPSTPVEQPQARGFKLIRDRKIDVSAEMQPSPPESTPGEPEAQATEIAEEHEQGAITPAPPKSSIVEPVEPTAQREEEEEQEVETQPPPPEQTSDEPKAQASETAVEEDQEVSDTTTSEKTGTPGSESPSTTSKKKSSKRTKTKSTPSKEV